MDKDVGYDTNYQETKLTLMVRLAQELWDVLDSEKLKVEMLVIIWHVFESCQQSYKDTCSTTFQGYENVPGIIDVFNCFPKKGTGDKQKAKILKDLRGLVLNYRNLFETKIV